MFCIWWLCLSKTHAEKINEAVKDLGFASPNEIMAWIRTQYPDDPVNPSSYRADIIGCSVNHSSSHHYPGMPKFLWFIEESKKYRIAKEDEADLQVPGPSISKRPPEPFEIIDGVCVSELSITGQLFIPTEIREVLKLHPRDKIGFIVNEGLVQLRKVKLRLSFEWDGSIIGEISFWVNGHPPKKTSEKSMWFTENQVPLLIELRKQALAARNLSRAANTTREYVHVLSSARASDSRPSLFNNITVLSPKRGYCINIYIIPYSIRLTYYP